MLLSLGKLVFWIQSLAPEIRDPEVERMRQDSEGKRLSFKRRTAACYFEALYKKKGGELCSPPRFKA
jgi:hypothetical protein